jgi:midasin (ATPase involved in ribosome maturation)
LTGTKLDEMAMNSSIDTTELLGGYEQVCFICFEFYLAVVTFIEVLIIVFSLYWRVHKSHCFVYILLILTLFPKIVSVNSLFSQKFWLQNRSLLSGGPLKF